jgi:small-conductance mechanosensitive channel
MSDTTEVQTEAEEMASVMAGYSSKARGDEPPAVVEPEPTAEAAPEPVAEVPAEPDVKTLADELKDLKARVASTAGDAHEVRKLHGAVGDINRTLKALQNPAQPTPDDSELSAALKQAESVAEEFPELAGPLVKALKLSMSRQTQQTKPEDITERVSAQVIQLRQQDAVEMLREEHPDFETVRETQEYKSWLAAKTPEFRSRFESTWNPAVVARGLTEFKDSLKTKARKQDRLAGAVSPQGVPQQARQSTLPDDEGFSIGYYQKGRKRL